MDKESATPSLVLATPLQPALPSWNDGPTKQAIIDFVARVTQKDGAQFVKREERIAVFDNDGTLWPERPVYFQAAFAIDRLKLLASQHAEWTKAPLANAILAGDLDTVAMAGERQVEEVLAWTHAGLGADEFEKIISNWLDAAQHPVFKRRYTELAYQPMQELFLYLRANGFKIFIVSGGGAEFSRVYAERALDIPPERVIGSVINTRFEFQSGKPRLVKQSRIEFVEDGFGKPTAIDRFIGRRPIFVMGNSDGDQQMLQWAESSEGAHFVGLIHHTDAEREFAYDRESHMGRLTRALAEARARNWVIVDMAKDWARVFEEHGRD